MSNTDIALEAANIVPWGKFAKLGKFLNTSSTKGGKLWGSLNLGKPTSLSQIKFYDKNIRVRHYTSSETLPIIKLEGIRPTGRGGYPFGVDVELQPFGNSSTLGAGGGVGAYIEFTVRRGDLIQIPGTGTLTHGNALTGRIPILNLNTLQEASSYRYQPLDATYRNLNSLWRTILRGGKKLR